MPILSRYALMTDSFDRHLRPGGEMNKCECPDGWLEFVRTILAPITSPPSRVRSLPKVPRSTVSLKNRTEPSTNGKMVPPGW